MKYLYPACFYPEGSQYSVFFPDLGISTYGNDLEDAMNMATDLLCMWVLDCMKDKTELPTPSDVKNVVPEQENGFVSIIVGDIEAYMTKKNEAVRKNVTIPAWLAELADKEGINFSRTLQNALKDLLHVGTLD